MKKSLIILLLMALSFVGNTQQRDSNLKFYQFQYEWSSIITGDVDWYQEVGLYIDGVYTQTFYIGNSRNILTASGFNVPIGSYWELRAGRTVATLNDYDIAIGVAYHDRGYADNTEYDYITIYVE